MASTTDHKARAANRHRKRPLNNERLRNWALGYLGRFASTQAHLVVVLERKIKRNLGPDEDPEVVDHWIQEASRTAADMVALGLIDDRGFATARARSLHARGKSRRMIIQTLLAKGVKQDIIDLALAALGNDLGGGKGAVEFDAAINLARRRKLGPFRRPESDSSETARRRAHGVLARAGFSYAVASRILGATGEAELLDHLEDLRADEAENG